MKIIFIGIFLLMFLSACSTEFAQELSFEDKSRSEVLLSQEQKSQKATDQTASAPEHEKQAHIKKINKRAAGKPLFCGRNDRKISISFSKDKETAFVYFFDSGKEIELFNTHIASGMEYEIDGWLLRGKDHNTALYQYGTKMMCRDKERKIKK